MSHCQSCEAQINNDGDECDACSELNRIKKNYEDLEKKFMWMPLVIISGGLILSPLLNILAYVTALFLLLILSPISFVGIIFTSIKLSRVSISGMVGIFTNILVFYFLFDAFLKNR
jgi:hypothetical protein